MDCALSTILESTNPTEPTCTVATETVHGALPQQALAVLNGVGVVAVWGYMFMALTHRLSGTLDSNNREVHLTHLTKP